MLKHCTFRHCCPLKNRPRVVTLQPNFQPVDTCCGILSYHLQSTRFWLIVALPPTLSGIHLAGGDLSSDASDCDLNSIKLFKFFHRSHPLTLLKP